MSDFKYDYIVVGRSRNRDKVNEVTQALRDAGKSVYCFTDNKYEGDGVKFSLDVADDPEQMMQGLETLQNWQTNPTYRAIFEKDLQGLKDAAALILVFPAGLSAHMELGVAYGMNKPCYAVGEPEKNETLYLMFDKMFKDTDAMKAGLL